MPLKKFRLKVGMLNKPPTLIDWPRNDRSLITLVSSAPIADPSITRHIRILINHDIARKLMNFVDMFPPHFFYQFHNTEKQTP
jgi:hypothetical protein